MKLKIFLILMAVIILMSEKTFAAIEITDERATPNYWTRIDGDEIILSAQEISELNRQMRLKDDYSADLKNFPQKISATILISKIKKATGDVEIKQPPEKNSQTAARSMMPAKIIVKYAVTTERANLRLLPQSWTGDDFDDLQGTAVDPAEGVAVLWRSADEKFYFVQTRNYFGWIEKDKLAFTTREIWLNYVEPKNFIVVTANKKFVDVGGKNILFQMGAKIPLADDLEEKNFWFAQIPVNGGGKLQEKIIKIPKDETIHKGFLPCTTNNFIKQSFKFLGDVYGWGGLKDSVDCSAFTSDIYRSMGIEIPRDSDRQEKSMPSVAKFINQSYDEKINILKKIPTGALLFKPGHVLMLLGTDKDGTPIAIHAASSYYLDDKKIYVSKVLVSAMTYPNDYGVSTVEKLTGVGFAR